MIHTVVENWCTGCGLCVPVCPVDCIELKVESDGVSTLSPSEARLRYEHHLNRLKIKSKNKPEQTYITFDKGSKEEMRDIIKAAIGRKKMKKVC
jgi:electron transport complex protein RnfB